MPLITARLKNAPRIQARTHGRPDNDATVQHISILVKMKKSTLPAVGPARTAEARQTRPWYGQ